MNEKKNRVVKIEGLRGLCALIVMISHFVVSFYPSAYWGKEQISHFKSGADTYLSQSPFSIFYAGNFAVCVFFVISGFAISNTYFNSDNDKFNKMIIMRFLKLFFPVLFINFLFYFCMKTNLIYVIDAAEITGSVWLADICNFEADFIDVIYDSFIRVMFRGSARYNGVFWTITYLFFGSSLIALTLYITKKIKNKFIIYLSICIASLSIGVQGSLNFYYFIPFISGLAIADQNTKKIGEMGNWFAVILLLISCFLASYPTGVIPDNIYKFLTIGKFSSELWHILAATLLVVVTLKSRLLDLILENEIIQKIGKYSFSIYLLHLLIIIVVSSRIFLYFYNLNLNYHISFIITFIISVIIIFFISFIFNKYIEKNFNKAICFIYYKLF